MPRGACYTPQTAHWNMHKDKSALGAPWTIHPSVRPSTCMFEVEMNRLKCLRLLYEQNILFPLSVIELMQRREAGANKGGFYCEMDASFNGSESEAVRKRMQRKERGSTNGIRHHPIIFKSK